MLLSRKWSIFDLLPLCRHLIACKSVMRVPRYKVYTRTLYANGRVFEKCQISTNACFIISIGGGGAVSVRCDGSMGVARIVRAQTLCAASIVMRSQLYYHHQ